MSQAPVPAESSPSRSGRGRTFVELVTCVAEAMRSVDAVYPTAGPAGTVHVSPCHPDEFAPMEHRVRRLESPNVITAFRAWLSALADFNRQVGALDEFRKAGHDHLSDRLHHVRVARERLHTAADRLRDEIAAELD